MCIEPRITNGQVVGVQSDYIYVGRVTCNPGYHLVSSSSSNILKCRLGQWSVDPLPVCSKIGSCLELEQIENGRNVPLVGSRGSAFKFRCRKGYKLYGEKNTHCIGDHWSHERLPVCTGFFRGDKVL